uniref:ankyrin-2-like n=1 Tax=Fragaria vesca subsp. vesca TaxID=101020 RepID=UPI0005C990C5|nr:PREDICTED: ankyrin-2-like [Fragaria vesca subsp. vesca]
MHQHQIQDSQLTDQLRLYHQLYMYASEGRQTDFITAIQKVADHDQNASMQLLSRLSPMNDSFLHTVVTFGHVSLAIEILKLHPSLLLVKNFEGDIVLHVAAKTGEGDDNMIRYIMEHVNLGSGQGQVTDIEKVDISVFRMKNDEENTPLHEALINGNHLEAKYLIKADPSVSVSVNKEKKSPFYLAAEAGLIEVVTLIVDSIAIQNNTGDQGNGVPPTTLVVEGKSPLHAATFGQKEDIYLSLLGNITIGYSSGTLPIHSASSKGHVHIVKLLLEHYPDLKELRNSSGENIPHVATREVWQRQLLMLVVTCNLPVLYNITVIYKVKKESEKVLHGGLWHQNEHMLLLGKNDSVNNLNCWTASGGYMSYSFWLESESVEGR